MAERVKKTESEWRERLTPQQFEVARRQGTEPAFSGEFWDLKEDGVYRCVCCGLELFRSDEKFDSGTGWPSFWAAAEQGHVKTLTDTSHGMLRIEVRCAACDAHLGHLFPDGPRPTGQRYCINSASLRFEKK